MLVRLAFFVFSLLPFVCPAQTNNSIIDSLNEILKGHPEEDSIRVNALIKKGNALVYNNPNEAMTYTNRALSIALKLNWMRGIAAAYRQKGVVFQVLSDLPNAIEYEQKALKTAEPLGDKEFNGGIYNNLGIIYLEIGEYDKGIMEFKKFISIARDLKRTRYESLALMNLGLAYMHKEDLDSAKSNFQKSLIIAEANKYLEVAAYAYSNMAEIYNRRKEYDIAIKYFNNSLRYAASTNNTTIKAQSMAGIGEAYFFMKIFDKAEEYVTDGLRLSKQIGNIVFQKENQQLLSDIYNKQGHYDKALRAYKEFINLRDSVINDEKKSEIVKKEMQFNSERKEAVLNAEHKAELHQQQVIRNFLVAGASLIILVSFLLFYSYKRRSDSKARQKEAELKAEIADTEMKVMRLQMNPHFIFNSLNSVSDYIRKNNPEQADEYLSKFAKVMRMTLENSEQQAIPLNEDLTALELYMQLEAKRLNNKFTYEIKVAGDIDKENTLVPPMIFQPFVENSIWHGISQKEGKGRIVIDIRKEDDMLHCIIDDDGIGRQQTTPQEKSTYIKKQSLGMKITKARIDILNRLKGSNANLQLMDKEQGLRAELILPFEQSF